LGTYAVSEGVGIADAEDTAHGPWPPRRFTTGREQGDRLQRELRRDGDDAERDESPGEPAERAAHPARRRTTRAAPETSGSAPELPVLLRVLLPIADVPIGGAGHDVLRHARAGQTIEVGVERELLGERLLRLGEEVMLAAQRAELAVDDGLHQQVREVREA